jgi:dihydropteridine reductase
MKVLVYGGCGGLGKAIVLHFKAAGFTVISVDIGENAEADSSVKVSLADDWVNQEKNVVQNVLDVLQGSKLEAVINVAGGWAGGNTQDADWVKNADLMWKQSVWSSTIAATIASKCLKEGGLLVLPGAAPATSGTPGMMGYGMAKAAVHQLVKSLGATGSGLPEGACTLGILPVTLDTPMNRKFMPKADYSTWTPLAEVAGTLERWTRNQQRPATGSLVSMQTENNSTYLRLEH